jgi:hypothetical protein
MYRLGLWLSERLGRTTLLTLEILAGLHVALAGAMMRAFDKLYPAIWWPIFALLIYVFLQVASKSRAEADRQEKEVALAAEKAAKEQARAAELKAICQYKRDTAGNLARLAKTLVEGTNHTRTLQASFLSHAVDVVKDFLELDRRDDRIAATWAIPVSSYTEWEVVAYDRNQTGRQPGRVRKIQADIPGAAQAFLTGDEIHVEDTQDEKVAKHFAVKPPYRSILSVPARTVNVKSGQNVMIDGHPNMIFGVLNVDCRDCGVLRADTVNVLRDIAYLLGVLEHIGGGANA